ncbi:WD40/YVTN/BNR-like repeat-containing protein [Burkholderia sp. LMU1-1-1.1]|uniref:WD40/YVTN/BNR-like repeat-containing protein n=1 Tax=Burkholderia sp. LMU1-1-1.1 TaxID=3135266 RepID=UPI00343E0EF8
MTSNNTWRHAACAILAAWLAATGATAAPANETPALKPARHDPYAANAGMLDADRAGKRVVAVGERGVILLSDDDGVTSRQATEVPADLTLTAVAFADERNGWAVGHGGVILHTADAGDHWELQRSDSATDQPLLTVHFRDARHGWAGGLWSLLLATSDGGKTWTNVTLAPPEGSKKADLNLLKIFASGRQLYIAAERGMVLHSADDGATWQYLATGSKASLWSGAASGAGTLVVGGLGGRMLRSTDGGAHWAAVEAGSASVTQLRADGQGLWAGTLDGRLLRSTDDGRSWSAVAAGATPLTAIVARAGGGYLRYGKSGLIK